MQTGSSSKLFTLVTALKQGIPFGFTLKVHNLEDAGPFYNCKHGYVPTFQVHNSDGGENGTIPLYFGTTASINAFYVSLEAHVGLCNVVKTAISLGVTRARTVTRCCLGSASPADTTPTSRPTTWLRSRSAR